MPEGWESFYLLVGGAAGALIGLLFVVVSLTAELDPKRTRTGSKVYVTPIVFHFGTVLLISAIGLMPNAPPHVLAVVIGAPAIWGAIYSILSVWRLGFGALEVPHWSDWLYYGVFPGVVYLALLVAGEAFWSGRAFAAHATAVGAVALLLLGIRDAWDVALWISQHPGEAGKSRE